MITKTFSSVEQLDPVTNKVIDKIFTITEVETINYEKQNVLSGVEVAAKLLDLKDKKANLQKKIDNLTEEINFYKLLI